jgi:hypothetical protein
LSTNKQTPESFADFLDKNINLVSLSQANYREIAELAEEALLLVNKL